MTRLFATIEGSNPQALVELKASPQGHLLVSGTPASTDPSAGGAAAEPNWVTSFSYTAGRLVSETRSAGAVTQTRDYTYDASGNLTGIGAWQ